MQFDLRTGRRVEVSVTDAAVIRNFYTVVLPDGTRTDAWERWLAGVENEVAPAIHRAIEMPVFELDDGDRERLARWIALQYLRGPDNRRQMSELAAFTLRAQVGMGGMAYLRYAMSSGTGRDVTLEEAERVWDDIHSEQGPQIVVDGEEHLQTLSRTFDQSTALVYGRSWERVTFERKRLLVSDSPVTLVPGQRWDERGLAGSAVIAVPLNRRTLLWLQQPTEQGHTSDRDRQPAALYANVYNRAAVLSAERFVYFHPEDDPVPADTASPRPAPPKMQISGGLDFMNRNRPLDDVLEQISTYHPPTEGSLIADYFWPIPGYRPPVWATE